MTRKHGGRIGSVGAVWLAVLAAALSLWTTMAAAAPLRVVASFSILGDMVSEIGGEHVDLYVMVGRDGDMHGFEPKPRDTQALARASVLVVNGLGLESWLERMLRTSGFKGSEIVATAGLVPRRLEGSAHAGHGSGHAGEPAHAGAVDPHAWQSPVNGIVYARNIAQGLAQADPAHAQDYQQRAEQYVARLRQLDEQIRQAMQAIAQDGRSVVVEHDSFGYFGREYGLRFLHILGLSKEAETSARELARLVDQVRQQCGTAIFAENASSSRMVQQIARETNLQVGGTLYSDALGPVDQPAGTYLGMLEWNARQLVQALKPREGVSRSCG